MTPQQIENAIRITMRAAQRADMEMISEYHDENFEDAQELKDELVNSIFPHLEVLFAEYETITEGKSKEFPIVRLTELFSQVKELTIEKQIPRKPQLRLILGQG